MNTMQDKKPLNNQNQAHGRWEVYYSKAPNEIYYIGNYVNGIECGYEMAIYDAEKGETPESYYAR